MQSVVTRDAPSASQRLAPEVLTYVAGAVIVLNLVDALWTLTYIEAGVARESNPLMEKALAFGPIAFVLAKLALVSLSVLLLWRLRERRSAAVALWSGAMTYTAIACYHLGNVHQLAVLTAAR